jgi:hypothetical protein
MRTLARYTARNFTWEAAVKNLISKLENQGRIQGSLSNQFAGQVTPKVPAEQIEAENARIITGTAEKQGALHNSHYMK